MCKKLLITFVGVLLLSGFNHTVGQELLFSENFEAGVAEVGSWSEDGEWNKREVIQSLAGKGIVGLGSKAARTGPIILSEHALNW